MPKRARKGSHPADPRPRSQSDGFTFIEALAALVILGIGLGVVMQVVATGQRSVQHAEAYTYALEQAATDAATAELGLPTSYAGAPPGVRLRAIRTLNGS